eukprot:jgi/Astpho2/5471/Aster-07811
MLNLSIRSSARPSTHVFAGRSRPSYSRYVGTQVATGPALTMPNKEIDGTTPDATANSTAFTNGKRDKAKTTPSPSLNGTSGLQDAVADIKSGDDTADIKVPGTITLKNCQLDFLDEVKIVGDNDSLGAWAVDEGVRMQWTEGHDWVAELNLSPDLNTFKMVIVHADGSIEWEEGTNRELQFNNTAETTLIM